MAVTPYCVARPGLTPAGRHLDAEVPTLTACRTPSLG